VASQPPEPGTEVRPEGRRRPGAGEHETKTMGHLSHLRPNLNRCACATHRLG